MPEQEKACVICDAEGADPARIVFRDELWAAEVMPGYEVPGWFILRVRRHAERITALSDEELAVLSYRMRDLVAAVTEATGAPATYMLVFGENYPHFHVLVASRGDDIPQDRRNGDVLKLRLERSDPAAALSLVPAVRASYALAGGDSLPR